MIGHDTVPSADLVRYPAACPRRARKIAKEAACIRQNSYLSASFPCAWVPRIDGDSRVTAATATRRGHARQVTM
jgi:hypothetical protein